MPPMLSLLAVLWFAMQAPAGSPSSAVEVPPIRNFMRVTPEFNELKLEILNELKDEITV